MREPTAEELMEEAAKELGVEDGAGGGGIQNFAAPRLVSLNAVYIRRDAEGNDIELVPLGTIAGEDYNPIKHRVHMAWLRLRHPEWWKLQKQLAEEMRNG